MYFFTTLSLNVHKHQIKWLYETKKWANGQKRTGEIDDQL